VTAIGRLLLVAAAALVVACGAPGRPPSLVVGATADAPGTVLAHVYAAALRSYGTVVRIETAAGTDDTLRGLDSGAVTLVPGFTGRLLQRFDPESTARSAAQVYRALLGSLPEGIAAGDYAPAAEDKPALAVTAATAQSWGSRDLVAVERNCAAVTVGTVTGRIARPAIGDCTLGAPREFTTDAALFDGLAAGAVTAAWTSTADTGVPDGVVVLVDRKPALIPAQNVVALYRRNELSTLQLRAVNEVAGVLDTAGLVDMLRRVEAGAAPDAVADEWLAANPLTD